jgi:hypothetical protein
MNSILGTLLFGTIVTSMITLWVYALISAIKNERLDPNMRLIWVLVIIFVNLIGALIYLFVAPDRPGPGERMLDEWNRRKRMGHR